MFSWNRDTPSAFGFGLFCVKLTCLPFWQKLREWNRTGCRIPLEGILSDGWQSGNLESYMETMRKFPFLTRWSVLLWIGHHSDGARKCNGTQPLSSMAYRIQATLGGPAWSPRALPLSLFSLAVGYYSRCTHWCPVKGEDHFHRHAGCTTANTAQGAGAAFATGPTAASC